MERSVPFARIYSTTSRLVMIRLMSAGSRLSRNPVTDVWDFALTDERVSHPVDFTIEEEHHDI